MLRLCSVYAAYGDMEVLKGVTLEVSEGELVTLIGPNGAGKSTTLMAISGAVPIKGGEVFFLNQRIHHLRVHQLVERGISQVPEGRHIFPDLSVLENLKMGAYIVNDRRQMEEDLDRIIEIFPILGERRSQRGATLSGGEQQMLALGRALMSRPRLLLMDEPSLGLSPVLVGQIFEMIQRIHEEGITILLVEQNARVALSMAQRAYVMEHGRIVQEGATPDLLKDKSIRSTYLGEA